MRISSAGKGRITSLHSNVIPQGPQRDAMEEWPAEHGEYRAQEIEALVGEFERLELFKLCRRIEARQ